MKNRTEQNVSRPLLIVIDLTQSCVLCLRPVSARYCRPRHHLWTLTLSCKCHVTHTITVSVVCHMMFRACDSHSNMHTCVNFRICRPCSTKLHAPRPTPHSVKTVDPHGWLHVAPTSHVIVSIAYMCAEQISWRGRPFCSVLKT